MQALPTNVLQGQSRNNSNKRLSVLTLINCDPHLTWGKENIDNFHADKLLSTSSLQLSSLFDQEQEDSRQLLHKVLSTSPRQL